LFPGNGFEFTVGIAQHRNCRAVGCVENLQSLPTLGAGNTLVDGIACVGREVDGFALAKVDAQSTARGTEPTGDGGTGVGLQALGYEFVDSELVPMVVVLLGSPQASLALGEILAERGILAPAIRPPTVPKGTSRIRMTPMATHTTADMEEALAAFPPASEIER
jgi:hypothetical protein